ncbi:MAG: M81 family metallopeptidase [Planctomycetaceae bacterium]|nr:M81 family metallopeptidase [Planctomycetaceae bacterium]
MTRIAIFQLMQEISSFNPSNSTIADFTINRGAAWIEQDRKAKHEIGGALAQFGEHDDVIVVPTISARSNSSGAILAASSWDELSTQLTSSIDDLATQHGGSIAAVYFCMHGAMAAENEMDPEGFILEYARSKLGSEIPFVTSMDLHGILTERMFEHSDVIVPYHTYPHVDQYETGNRSAKVVMRLLREDSTPVSVRVQVPALVRGDELVTETGLFGECLLLAKQIEDREIGLAAGMLIGNPFTDVPELRTNVVVTFLAESATEAETEGEAIQYATEMAELFWVHRERMRVKLTSIDDAVIATIDHHADPETDGTVVLVDAADATSSGASGDSNAIFSAILASDFQGRLLAPLVDAPAVQAAIKAGVGNNCTVNLGGTVDPGRFTPLECQAKVRLIADGDFFSESFKLLWRGGPTVVLDVKNHTIVVSTCPVNHFDRSFFLSHGCNPFSYDAVVVKSPHCEPHMYQERAALYIDVDAPGSTSANLKSLGHTQCPRPIFPLDEDVAFCPNK